MSAQSNAEEQQNELLALESIYGEGFLVPTATDSYSLGIPAAGSSARLSLALHLPESYPSTHPPLFELHSDFLPGDVLEELSQELEAAFCPGEVVLFNWIEHLKQRWEELAPQQQQQEQEQGEAEAAGVGTDAAAEVLEQCTLAELRQQQQQRESDGEAEALQLAVAEVVESIVHGEPFTEKRSTFQAHLAPVVNLQQVEAVMEVLLQNNKIRAATHNIMAYRIEAADKPGVFQQDCDDDGEAAAGGRLLHLLQMVDARNVVVVVSRWYGGILLGPARFTHINNAARELLDACGYIGGGGGGGGGKAGPGGKKGGKSGKR